MAEVHLAHTKMQRAYQKQLTKIDASFMYDAPARERPGQQSSRRALEPLPARLPIPAAAQAAPAKAVVDTTRLFFGDSMGPLAGRLASLSLYEQRNDDYFKALRLAESMSEALIKQLQTSCQKYQKSLISVQEWIRLVFEQLGVERAKRVVPALVELQLDGYKTGEMNNAFKSHLHKLDAFPPLPPGVGAPSKHTTATGSPTIGRMGHGKTVRLVSQRGPGVDPSKNPLGLGSFGTGRGSSAGSKKKQAPAAPPGFSQAAAAGTGTAMASVASHAPKAAASRLDDAQFPSLLLPKSTPAPQAPALPTTSFITADEDDSFTIGASSQPAGGDQLAEAKKKTKRQVVLRFG